MPGKAYVVRLSGEERTMLESITKKGKGANRLRHAQVLLSVDADGPDWTDKQAAQAYGFHANTVANIRRRCVEQGLEAALERKKQEMPSRARKLDGDAEARLITLACSAAPEGRASWTLRLLADELVALQVVDEISYETVRRVLKKRTEAPFAELLGHPAKTERSIRCEHGRRS